MTASSATASNDLRELGSAKGRAFVDRIALGHHVAPRLVFLLLLALAAPAPSAAQTLIRVSTAAGLQPAIDAVGPGGIIEIAAGTYVVPATLWVSGRPRFKIRAAPGANVILSGGGVRRILTVFNNGTQAVTFEHLTFADGVDGAQSIAGGAIVSGSQATFVDCVFQNNGSATNGGSGGMWTFQSTVFFQNSVWTGNKSKNGGAGIAIFDATVYIHDSQFVNNRTNFPGHETIARGGAISMSGGKLRVTNTRFEANQAGHTAGALYVNTQFTAAASDVVVANSTFVDNQAISDPSVVPLGPSTGGAVHVEDNSTAKFHNCRFVTNSARQGGAIGNYRGVVEITNGVFQGNRATTVIAGETHGLGGAIIGLSDDSPPTGPNRRPMRLAVTDTLFQGRFGSVTTTARQGGCLFLGGDFARNWGANADHSIDNHATVDLTRVVFDDCDVAGDANFAGRGGALYGTLLDLTVTDSLILSSDASGGTFTAGGGFALQLDSSATLTGTTFARNSAGTEGGGLWMSGGALNLDQCNLVENTLTSGSNGSALKTGPSFAQSSIPASDIIGLIHSSTISNNAGSGFIHETDTGTTPVNRMEYASNTIFPAANAFFNPSVGLRSVEQLNSLVLHGEAKAPSPNSPESAPPVVGAILAVPPLKLPSNASGDPAPPTAAYLAYAWSGANATLDGQARSGNAGLEAGNTGTHTLSVATVPFMAAISDGPLPDTALTANPSEITKGSSTSLHWTTLAGSFLEQAIDQGVPLPLPATADGSVSVSPQASVKCRGFLVAEEGGDVDTAMIDLTGANDRIFRDGFD